MTESGGFLKGLLRVLVYQVRGKVSTAAAACPIAEQVLYGLIVRVALVDRLLDLVIGDAFA